MICEKCKAVIPDHCLVCPGCALDKSREATRVLQHHALAKLEAGQGVFQTRQFAGATHLKLFHCAMTFCDISIEAGRKGEIAMSQIGPHICPKCLAALEGIVADMRKRAQQAVGW